MVEPVPQLLRRAREALPDDAVRALDVARAASGAALRARETGSLIAARCLEGRALYALSRTAEAREAFEEARSLAQEDDPQSAATALCYLAMIAVRQGRHRDALLLGEEGLAAARDLGETWLEAEALNALGGASYFLGDHAAALERYQASLALREEQVERMGERWLLPVLTNLGTVYAALDRPEEAAEALERALAGAERHHDRRTAAICGVNLAHVHVQAGDLEAATRRLHATLERLGPEGADDIRGLALANLGDAELKMDRPEAALSSFESALQIAGSGPYTDARAVALTGLAAARLQLGDHEAAGEALRRALEAAEEVGVPARRAEVHRLLSLNQRAVGDWKAALEHFERYHELHVESLEGQARQRVERLMVLHDVEQLRSEKEITQLRYVELERLHARLAEVSIRDGLTGAFNRRHLDERLAEAFGSARAEGRALSVILCDLDRFKSVNDRHSHAVGDEVLREVARLLRESVRERDLVARYGGEEFVVMLEDTTEEQAVRVAEKLRRIVESHPWAEIRPGLGITLSLGVAGSAGHADHEAMLNASDARLYQAKRGGRNRVVA